MVFEFRQAAPVIEQDSHRQLIRSGQIREPACNRLIEIDLTLFNQLMQGGGDEGFSATADAEAVAGCHRGAALAVGDAAGEEDIGRPPGQAYCGADAGDALGHIIVENCL